MINTTLSFSGGRKEFIDQYSFSDRLYGLEIELVGPISFFTTEDVTGPEQQINDFKSQLSSLFWQPFIECHKSEIFEGTNFVKIKVTGAKHDVIVNDGSCGVYGVIFNSEDWRAVSSWLSIYIKKNVQ